MIYVVIDTSDYYTIEVMDCFKTRDDALMWIGTTGEYAWRYEILERKLIDLHCD